MQREILFKAKRKDNGEWVKGDFVEGYFIDNIQHCYIIEKENLCKCDEYECFGTSQCYEVIPETVSQYTGLKDKNGVKIFDGDIVKATEYLKPGEVDLFYKVEYIARLGSFRFNPLIINGKFDNNNNELGMYYYEQNDIEVIGNIFDEE